MRFSIIVPVYNIAQYLNKCIDSILKQTYTDFELILINDGSTDNSLDICNLLAQKDSRLQVINQKNNGATSARKHGAIVAKGDYIVCIDGDDYVESDFLSTINEEINTNKADVVCFGYRTDRNGSIGNKILNLAPCKIYTDVSILTSSYLFDKEQSFDNSGCLLYMLWAKVIKRSIYVECQLLVDNHIKNGEDLLLIGHYLSRVTSVSVIDYAGYYYRDNNASTTKNRKSYDLVNVSNVKNELLKIGVYPNDNIYHYYFASVFTLIRDIAKQNNFRSFMKIVRENLNIDKESEKYKFTAKLSRNTRIKFAIVQKRLWVLEFILVKVLKIG